MTSIEEKISINVAPEKVFAIYADVRNWRQWDPDTRSSSIDGPFATGARGKLKPAQGFEVPMRLVSVVENRSFTVESPAPLCLMSFEHELTPTGDGVVALHRVKFSGPLAGFFGWLVGGRVRKGLPVTMANLKRAAEVPVQPVPVQQVPVQQ